MDFRREKQDDRADRKMSYNPPPIPEPSFFKHLLPCSSSLLSDGVTGARNGQVQPSPASYRECLRNHAASLGSHVLDGCGEFMPGAADSVKCAACGCHRSFHRRESQSCPLFRRQPPNHTGGRIPLVPPPALQRQIQFLGAAESSSEELGLAKAPSSKKRLRTKFTEEQKVKMMEFAERIAWRIQRQEEDKLEGFLAEIGIGRQVFKVWMHNNKKKKKKRRDSIRKQEEEDQNL